MASAFKTATSADVGTSLTTVYTAPSSTTSTIIGLYLCNQSGGQIEATCQMYDTSASAHISLIHSSPIPSGSTLVLVGGDGKVVLEAGDIIKVQSNVASSIDVVLSYLEQT
tara:strand:+ start:2168 stop:2500 length:333 start_codon:yes stop_codon:yes gene_type:complete